MDLPTITPDQCSVSRFKSIGGEIKSFALSSFVPRSVISTPALLQANVTGVRFRAADHNCQITEINGEVDHIHFRHFCSSCVHLATLEFIAPGIARTKGRVSHT
jgi:hypothetical protein